MFGTEADRRARNVDGDVATADNDNLSAKLCAGTEIDRAQKVDAGYNALSLFPFDIEFASGLCADTEEKGFIALRTQFVQTHVFADLGTRFKLDAQITQNVDFGFDNFFFETEGGNAERKHAAELLLLFENGYRIAFDGKIVRA